MKFFGGVNMLHIKNLGVFLTIVFLALSCATVKTPQNPVPKRTELETEAYGARIRLTSKNEQHFKWAAGELLCIHTDFVYVLNDAGNIEVINKKEVKTAHIVLYQTLASKYTSWALLGTLSTASHGKFMVISFPLWLISGISISRAEAQRINYLYYPETSWKEISHFARFPQGLPTGLNLNKIKPRL